MSRRSRRPRRIRAIRSRRRDGLRAIAGALLALGALAACTSGQPDPSDPAQTLASDPVALERVEESDYEQVPSAIEDPAAPGLPAPLVDPADLVSGGPPPDGIPAIDEPLFERASSVTWLDADEPVLSLQVDGEARAYPVRIAGPAAGAQLTPVEHVDTSRACSVR